MESRSLENSITKILGPLFRDVEEKNITETGNTLIITLTVRPEKLGWDVIYTISIKDTLIEVDGENVYGLMIAVGYMPVVMGTMKESKIAGTIRKSIVEDYIYSSNAIGKNPHLN